MRISHLCTPLKIVLLLVPIGIVQGCTAVPSQEAQSFANGASAVKTASDALFDKLDVAERGAKLNTLNDRGIPYSLENAYYYSTIGEPPLTNQWRKSTEVLVDYANLLSSLVNGTSSASSQATIQSISSNLTTIAGLSATASAPIASAALALVPVIDSLEKAQDAAEARKIALEKASTVRGLIQAMKAATPAMYNMLRADAVRTGGVDPAKLRAYRSSVADYVVLLDKLEAAYGRLLDAYQHPADSVTLAGIAEASGQLSADATALRAALAAVR